MAKNISGATPFLQRIFSKDTPQPHISEGWIYGTEEAAVYGGFIDHHAIDFAVPIGTPVLAAADGFALASFEELPIRYPTQEARTWQGEPVFWGYGLFVAILHPNGLITTYAHLHRLADEIWRTAYVPPIKRYNGDVVCPITALDVADFGERYRVVPVHAGDVIGLSGITGMGIGSPTFNHWQDNTSYRANDEPHVHFAVSKVPGLTHETLYVDPFGIYGKAAEYPLHSANWAQLSNSLWLM